MILQVDIGNSRIKWRLRRQGRTLESGVGNHGDYQWLQGLALQQVWVSSVVALESESLQAALAAYGLPRARFASAQASAGGVVNGYQVPATLGVDRWLALLGARQLSVGPAVVVDAGTALTVDLLGADGRHRGGYIAPGLTLMQQSLALKSQALAVNFERRGRVAPGDSSATAIEAALVAMGRGLIETGRLSLSEYCPADPVLLLFTGGDGDFWQRVLAEGSSEPELLFIGLERYFTQGQG
ncbi:type III pantothenate kinase [Gilvimarinus japonicus]|jgi:type III pantothenate kinase|uniref:Type III pantothenate kinase n=1 Tax=Gilvimarinus japonicus TaxID=1796469 RepID=A0ABV7HJ55_9GAMM